MKKIIASLLLMSSAISMNAAVNVKASVKAIKAYAFAECDKLKKITFAGTPPKPL